MPLTRHVATGPGKLEAAMQESISSRGYHGEHMRCALMYENNGAHLRGAMFQAERSSNGTRDSGAKQGYEVRWMPGYSVDLLV